MKAQLAKHSCIAFLSFVLIFLVLLTSNWNRYQIFFPTSFELHYVLQSTVALIEQIGTGVKMMRGDMQVGDQYIVLSEIGSPSPI